MYYDFQSEIRLCLEETRRDLAGAVVQEPYYRKEWIQLCVLFYISEEVPQTHFKNPVISDLTQFL